LPYCTPQDVRDLTGLTTSDLTDTQISGIIAHATAQLNADIQVKWEDEGVGYISQEKENKIDSSNTVYYTQHYPIGDMDNNGIISGADVSAYTLDSSGNRTDIVVTTIDDSEIGKLTLSTAPAEGDALFFTYYSSPVDMETPHELVKLACTQLSAALCYTRIDAGKVQAYKVGKISVMKQSEAFEIYKKWYQGTISKIHRKPLKVAYGEELL